MIDRKVRNQKMALPSSPGDDRIKGADFFSNILKDYQAFVATVASQAKEGEELCKLMKPHAETTMALVEKACSNFPAYTVSTLTWDAVSLLSSHNKYLFRVLKENPSKYN